VPILSLAVEPDGKTLWFMTPDGVFVSTSEILERVDPHPALDIRAQARAMAIGESGQRWFGYTEGVIQQFPSRLLCSGDDLDPMTRGENSLCNCIKALEVDATGECGRYAGRSMVLRTWVLAQVYGRHRTLSFLDQCTGHNPGGSIGMPMDRRLARRRPAGGNGNGLRQLIGTTDVPLPGGAPDLPYVDTVTCDSQGQLWVGAQDQVLSFDGRQWTSCPHCPVKLRVTSFKPCWWMIRACSGAGLRVACGVITNAGSTKNSMSLFRH